MSMETGSRTNAREYVNVYHSHAYIRDVWSRYFDVLAILPAYIFTHDLIVLRKKRSRPAQGSIRAAL